MPIDYTAHGIAIQAALRNLFLCRIRLQGDLDAGETTVVVRGGVSANPDVGFDGHGIPFQGRTVSTATGTVKGQLVAGIAKGQTARVRRNAMTSTGRAAVSRSGAQAEGHQTSTSVSG